MSALCCTSIQPYRNIRTDHEQKFVSFLAWFTQNSDGVGVPSDGTDPSFVIQLVKQVNYGPILSKRFFVSPSGDDATSFYEVNEDFVIEKNFQKLNTYKNYKCPQHNYFFELNVYCRDTRNAHHWRSDVARPAAEIDILPQ